MGNSDCLRAYGEFLLSQGVWGIPIVSGRMGNFYCLKAYGELFHFRLHITLGESRFDDVTGLQLRGRTDALAIFQRNAVTAFQ